jgi:hypothetical protein
MKVPQWNLGYHVCCSHVITTRSVLGILVFENATHRTYYFSTLCLSSVPWLTSWVKQVMLTLHHEHHVAWAYASTHFINMCIIMCARHHARIVCITHYASLHKHHKFMCISLICSYAYTWYYMHLIISIIMCTIPLMHNSSYALILQACLIGAPHIQLKVIAPLMGWRMPLIFIK